MADNKEALDARIKQLEATRQQTLNVIKDVNTSYDKQQAAIRYLKGCEEVLAKTRARRAALDK